MGETSIDMQDIVQSLDAASQDKDCAAIVVRINSPGGTPEASDELRRAAVKAGELKPLIVSMGNVAASGGYWAAVNARSIIASPMTLTGSIGVFGGKISVGGLLNKLGVQTDGIQIGRNADLYATDKPYTPEQRKKVEAMMDEIYQAFVERVAFGRGLPIEKVRELAKGRVYTGEQALKIGLVDELGGLDRAVEKAAQSAGLSPSGVSTLHYPGPRSVFDRLSDVLDETGLVYRAIMQMSAYMSASAGTAGAVYGDNHRIY